MLVPVLSKDKKPLMPCSPARARLLMKNKEAVSFYQKGIFCIKLTKEPSDDEFQAVALGIDPGSKREGYTVATAKAVAMNITTNTRDWIKNNIKTRKALRHSRRQRNCPYRIARKNRASLKMTAPYPSVKARWDAKINIIKQLIKIFPISIINIEEIKFKSIKGKKNKKNLSFCPLEMNKGYFDKQIKILNIKIIKTQGRQTSKHRIARGFAKTNNKLLYSWDAHNSDSHSLAEIALGSQIKPYKGLYKIEYIKLFRRKLHVQNQIKNGYRKPLGSTVSIGISRGAVVKYKGKLCYIGGSVNKKISLHNIENAKRFSKTAKKEDIIILFNSKQRTNFIKQ